ncbi:glutathione peroxidase [Paenibacillus caui]|uniref:glutathione peroxidase n=1 Tax=Paenibacillus caui TaxID=2873927 RepID=UPI001CA85E04|nr:glutathione peroxidase [Paenibacillus caui]
MTIYNYVVEKPNGEPIALSDYQGKVLLIVNTASKCKFTPQFDDLQKVYSDFQQYGFEILGFPCNQFGGQEPGTNEEAVAFCQINYGVKFPIFAKLEVNGHTAHPLFQYLKQEAPFNGFDESNIQSKLLKMIISEKNPEWLVGDAIKWNFTKFLINQSGEVVRRYEPNDEISTLQEDIVKLLKA